MRTKDYTAKLLNLEACAGLRMWHISHFGS